PSLLILHYTGMATAEQAIARLCDPRSQVSCHYLVDDDGQIVQMVDEDRRAWHAGMAAWGGERDINSWSIGIEVQNPGHDHGYRDFPEAQMVAVEALAGDIVARHGIAAHRVLAHSDVAPGRKIDPGEKFDWARLARAGVGHWVSPEPAGPLIAEASRQADRDTTIHVQRLLRSYGSGIQIPAPTDEQSRTVVPAWQRPFRP